ncbi:hypothetical protein [Sulfurimonas sp.]
MDIEIITEDITQHVDNLLNETADIIDDNFKFIDENGLIEPKKDYIILIDFLNKAVNHFSNLDYSFLDDTLKKTHRDVNNLNKLYEEQKNNLKNPEELFHKKVFPRIGLFKQIQKSLLELQHSDLLKTGDDETIALVKEHFAQMQHQYKEMRKIYLEVFIEEFSEQTKDMISSLEIILNTKIYYLDKFLWMNALKSTSILRSINSNEYEFKSISSKEYLQVRIDVALPYTKDYEYLQKCLRIYK